MVDLACGEKLPEEILDALKDYGSMKFIIGHTDEEIKSAYEKMKGISSPQLDGMPHHHNPQASEVKKCIPKGGSSAAQKGSISP